MQFSGYHRSPFRSRIEKEEIAVKPLVSFAVGLAANNFTVKGSHVPKHVIYDQVIVNESTGEGFNRAGYSPISGSFVAPVEGKL